MERCSVSHLPVTRLPEWSVRHGSAGYVKEISVIGNDIIHSRVVADVPVVLDYMDNDLIHSVIDSPVLRGSPIHWIWNLQDVDGMSWGYKKDITNLLYRWSPSLRLIVFYNLRPSFRTMMETAASVVPAQIEVIFADSFKDAVESTLAFKSGTLPQASFWGTSKDEGHARLQEFLCAVAKMTWFNMLDQVVPFPAADSPYYPFLRSIACMQDDLRSRAAEHQAEMADLRRSYEQRLDRKKHHMKAQMELHRQALQGFEEERSRLLLQLCSKEQKLESVSRSVAEKRAALDAIARKVMALEDDAGRGAGIAATCRSLFSSGSSAPIADAQAGIRFAERDRAFITLLEKIHPSLTPRELQTLLLMKHNTTNRELSGMMGVSARGVESLRYRIHKKLGIGRHRSIKSYLLELSEG
ncbi:helix-turn-helix transcriptional regulator [Pelodictyon luteolum]|uniref:HTH luxR-type domain-containing protein n=1 Tax=Chlorobium luteolum (strain DSM 273 / BCRC 81028 / 2530) TaxID=319225 RepID=Q3B3K5_CHLL3|nr:LuxR C-terminal-related transcriptional regulator [Pelodictyon luteolum]ABB24076.1 conserved hypothetical protein [Pelodictyon luteolum DSM 273]